MSDHRNRLTPIGKPSEVDMAAAEQGYLRYLTGVSVLYDPTTTQALHRVDLSGVVGPVELEQIAAHGEDLVLRGLKQVIRFCTGSNDPSARPAANLADEQTILLPRMTGVAGRVYERHWDLLGRMSPVFALTFLTPMNDPSVYKYFRHSNHHRVATLRLIDPLQPSPMFGGLFEDRSINQRTMSTSS